MRRPTVPALTPASDAPFSFPAALARAYAALGLVRDGALPSLPLLDAQAQGFLDQARELLDQDHVRTATPRPAGSAPDRSPTPIRGDLDKVLTAPDAWVAIPYDPQRSAGQPLTIANKSGGDYGYCINGEDFGMVRVDGGLVVPGRFYRLDGRITITSAVPVGIHIRPLHTLGAYADAPRLPPRGKG